MTPMAPIPHTVRGSEVALDVHMDTFIAEASELGLKPGEWPTNLATDLGNGLALYLSHFNEYGAVYKQMAGCITVTILND